jgi:glycosyltransferase involved in cell wall biosynthesis
MKILIVTFTFPPQVGGVAEVARTQAIGFSCRGHEVIVATTRDERRRPEDAPAGVAIQEFAVRGSYLAGKGYHGEIAAFQEFIARSPADVILFHCWQNWATDLSIPALAHTRARKVLLSHGYDAQLWKPQPHFAWGLGAWLRAWPYVVKLPRMMRAFDRIVFLSEKRDWGRFFDARLARRLYPERVVVIPNGVHRTEFTRERADFRRQFGITSRFLVLHVANYDDRKNQISTLRDFMAANRADATLVFIGGEFNEYSRQMVRTQHELQARYPRAQVLLLDKIAKEWIYAAYQAADVFLLGAKHETQPLAILDAMAAGVPFIATNVGCVREFSGGLIRRAGAETTTAIAQLLQDDAERQRLGEAGRQACEQKYDWDRILEAYERLFATLVPKKS